VARRARNFDVRTIERVVRLPLVIEIPSLPASRAVASLALAAKRTFVNVIAIVTFGAKRRRILVRRCAMTGLALRSRMRSRQLESGFVVIVWNTRPFSFIVASLTLVA
jgi:hypothetical protein